MIIGKEKEEQGKEKRVKGKMQLRSGIQFRKWLTAKNLMKIPNKPLSLFFPLLAKNLMKIHNKPRSLFFLQLEQLNLPDSKQDQNF